jgi:hypothetical protein
MLLRPQNSYDVSVGIVNEGKYDLQASGGLKWRGLTTKSHEILSCFKDYTAIRKSLLEKHKQCLVLINEHAGRDR